MIGIIGGTGASALGASHSLAARTTPFGPPSAPLESVDIGGREVVLLARHGRPHAIAPHDVNYRANVWALREAGVDRILATYAVGGIAAALGVGDIVIPDQVIDYTWGRAHAYSEHLGLSHFDFTEPFDPDLRSALIEGAKSASVTYHDRGTYGCTQGPRLESRAEIDRLDRDGCTVVGMTAMPESALACELGIRYAGACLVVNPAAGRGDGPIGSDEIGRAVETGMARLLSILAFAVERLEQG